MKTAQWKIGTKIRTLYLVASEKGLQGIYWKKQNAPMAKSLQGTSPEIKILARAARQMEEYMKGTRRTFDVPMDVAGTPFQKSVWKALSGIPYGRTCSYQDIARGIKNPKAVRAVGTANGKNPLCILVPCHRVIAADGSIGGYAGGLAMKRRLLELEKKAV